MRKTAAALITLLLITAAGPFLVRLGKANPYLHDWKMEGTIPLPEGTKPLEVLIFSPANQTAYPSSNIQLNFTTSIPKLANISLSINEVYYDTSWEEGKTVVDLYPLFAKNNYTWPTAFSISMTGVPEGPHWITVYAGATAFAYETRHETVGIYYTQYYVSYKTAGFSMVNFTIDTVKPRILSLSVLNKTLSASDVRLEMLTNEPIMKTTCSLDGQTNVTIIGNTTLSGLPVGLHNITVYVWDAAGNVGASETISFTVVEPESFPTVPVIAVFAGSAVAVAGAGLVLFTRRKRHREAKQT